MVADSLVVVDSLQVDSLVVVGILLADDTHSVADSPLVADLHFVDSRLVVQAD